jgi:ABC-type polysaccharide/polyol phosphate transport system ATPase subunit
VDDLAISARGLSKKYCADLRRSLRYGATDIFRELTLRRTSTTALRPGEFWAVGDASFDLAPQQALGIVGRNGAGKSTLLRMLAGVTKPDAGEVRIRGRVGSLLSLGAGFNLMLTGRENILIEGAALGISRQRISSLLDDIIDFSELGSFIDAPVHTYSSGMRMRLGFSIASSLDVDILLLDEVLIVGDINFRRKSVEHIKRFLADGGSLVFASHEMYLIQAMCTEALYLQAGGVKAQGDVIETIKSYYEELEAADGSSNAVPHAGTVPPPAAKRSPQAAAAAAPAPPVEPPAAAVIEQLVISRPGGGPIRTGEPAEIEVHIEVLEPEVEVWWGFNIWTPDRAACLTTQGTYDQVVLVLKEGRHVLRSTIGRMPLMSGTFLLGGALIDPHSNMPIALLGHDDQGTLFTVESEETEMAAIQRTGGALIDVDVAWGEPSEVDHDLGPASEPSGAK